MACSARSAIFRGHGLKLERVTFLDKLTPDGQKGGGRGSRGIGPDALGGQRPHLIVTMNRPAARNG